MLFRIYVNVCLLVRFLKLYKKIQLNNSSKRKTKLNKKRVKLKLEKNIEKEKLKPPLVEKFCKTLEKKEREKLRNFLTRVIN
jgi:hypothetical protein